jgi:hypothetical protein
MVGRHHLQTLSMLLGAVIRNLTPRLSRSWSSCTA